jgi:hypothetical protein
MTKVPMLKVGQDSDGLILSQPLISDMLERFYASKETIPCFNDKGTKVGDVKQMSLNNDVVYFHIDFKEGQTYENAKPGIEYAARVLEVKVS